MYSPLAARQQFQSTQNITIALLDEVVLLLQCYYRGCPLPFTHSDMNGLLPPIDTRRAALDMRNGPITTPGGFFSWQGSGRHLERDRSVASKGGVMTTRVGRGNRGRRCCTGTVQVCCRRRVRIGAIPERTARGLPYKVD